VGDLPQRVGRRMALLGGSGLIGTLLLGATQPRKRRLQTPPPMGWIEEETVSESTVLVQGIYIADGDDADLGGALKTVPPDIARAAVRVA
jgi:hypothetical protein